MNKKHFLVSLVIIFLLSFSFLYNRPMVNASSKAELYANKLTIKAGDEIAIPVYIRDNPGLMAYMMTLQYDSKIFEISEISPGNLCENGIFDNNLTIRKLGKVEILWSYTKEIKEDGTLFYLKVKAKKNVDKPEKIHVIVQKDETFNEKYEEVDLHSCYIEISGGEQTFIDDSNKPKEEKVSLKEAKKSKKSSDSIAIQDEKKSLERKDKDEEEKKQKTAKIINEKEEAEKKESISGKSIKIDEVVENRGGSQEKEEDKQDNIFWLVVIPVLSFIPVILILYVRHRQKTKVDNGDDTI